MGTPRFSHRKRTEVDKKYAFRYSVLIRVFSRLISEGWITLGNLEGLDKDKITIIKKML